MKFENRFYKSVMVCSFLLVIFLGVVSANSCGVKPISQCTGTWNNIIFEMSSDGNAHVQSPNAANDYQYAFCCDYTGSTDCSAPGATTIIKMYSATNSHAEIPDKTSPIYTLKACYDGLSCSSVNANPTSQNYGCSTGTAVLSLSTDTNAHAGIQGAYTGTGAKTICCNVAAVPQECTLTDASWSKTTAIEGEQITLTLTGSAACNNKLVKFEIFKDSVTGTLIKSIQGSTIKFNLQTSTTTWTAEYPATGTGNVNYIFKATLNEDTNKYKDSGLLSVAKGICGDGFAQTSRGEECDDGNTIDTDACDNQCHISTTTITSCRDYTSQGQEVCEADPEERGYIDKNEITRIGNCVYYENHFCEWESNGCGSTSNLIAPQEESDSNYPNPSNCVVPETRCRYTETPNSNCDNQDIITIDYLLNATSSVNYADCTPTYSRDVPCPETSMLPFFGFYQVIISLTIISIIYFLMVVRKKK